MDQNADNLMEAVGVLFLILICHACSKRKSTPNQKMTGPSQKVWPATSSTSNEPTSTGGPEALMFASSQGAAELGVARPMSAYILDPSVASSGKEPKFVTVLVYSPDRYAPASTHSPYDLQSGTYTPAPPMSSSRRDTFSPPKQWTAPTKPAVIS
jgi:hypothetical protein